MLKLRTLFGAAACLVVGSVGAQTPVAELPGYDVTLGESTPVAEVVAATPVEAYPPTIEPIPAPSSPSSPLTPAHLGHPDALPVVGAYPAVTESTGTWLRRGLWYADLDAVVMARTWNNEALTIAEEYDSITNQTTATVNVQVLQNIVRTQSQSFGESSPGYDGSARLALGRFLFRDQANRDHTAEMVVFGGAEWQENIGAAAQLTAAGEGLLQFRTNPVTGALGTEPVRDSRGLHVPIQVDGSAPIDVDDITSFASFDQSDTMNAEYSSRFHSWEWNYSVAQRMRTDRMELLPSGEWVRRASPGLTWDYTAGLRYFDVEERFDWTATNIASVEDNFPPDGQGGLIIPNGPKVGETDGDYLIRTSNNLFGLQIGVGMTYETDRWNVSIQSKHGFAINDGRGTTELTFVDGDGDIRQDISYQTDLHENGVSYLTQGGIIGRYHLRPNFSLRAGWEFMYVTGLALAPNQADFNPAAAQLSLTGDAFYHGVSFGTEYYW